MDYQVDVETSEQVVDGGQVLPLTALLLLPLLFLSAFAIDLGAFYLRASELQTVSDVAALSGAELLGTGSSESEVRAAVEQLVIDNGIDLADVNLQISINGDEVSVSLFDDAIPQYFSTLMVDQIDVGRDATATTGGCFDCSTPIELASTGGTLPSGGEGDGYKPLIVEVGGDVRFYALNHHTYSTGAAAAAGGAPTPTRLVCVSGNANGICPGFNPTRMDTATVAESTLTYTPSTQQIWFYASRIDTATNRTNWGIGCFNLDGTICAGLNGGMVRMGTQNQILTYGGMAPNTIVNGSARPLGGDIIPYASNPSANGDRVYMIDYRGRVHCWDAVTSAMCWGSPQGNAFGAEATDTWQASVGFYDWRFGVVPSFTQGSKLYVGFTQGSRNSSVILCYDMANEAPCSDSWSTWTPSTPDGLYWLFGAYSTGVGESGACVSSTASFTAVCRTGDGATSTSAGLNNMVATARAGTVLPGFQANPEGNPLRHGELIFIPEFSYDTASADTLCYNTVTNSTCGSRRANDNIGSHTPYEYTQLPNQDCFAAFGDQQVWDLFDSNMQTCSAGSSQNRITPCDCGGGDFRWGTLTFSQQVRDNFTSFEVTLVAPNGDVILGPVDVLAEDLRIQIPETADGLAYLELEIDSEANTGVDVSVIDLGEVTITERAVLID